MSGTTAATTVCVDPRTLRNRLDDVEIIDVRTPGEFESVHVPTAQNHLLDALDASVDDLRELVEEGREVVFAWQSDGGPVVQDVIRRDLERQVRFAAGVIFLVSILLSLVFPPARFVAGALGAGLVFAAVTNTCAMGMLLAKLPYNRPRTA